MVSQVNRATLQDHPRVITPNEESSAHVKVAAVGKDFDYFNSQSNLNL